MKEHARMKEELSCSMCRQLAASIEELQSFDIRHNKFLVAALLHSNCLAGIPFERILLCFIIYMISVLIGSSMKTRPVAFELFNMSCVRKAEWVRVVHKRIALGLAALTTYCDALLFSLTHLSIT